MNSDNMEISELVAKHIGQELIATYVNETSEPGLYEVTAYYRNFFDTKKRVDMYLKLETVQDVPSTWPANNDKSKKVIDRLTSI